MSTPFVPSVPSDRNRRAFGQPLDEPTVRRYEIAYDLYWQYCRGLLDVLNGGSVYDDVGDDPLKMINSLARTYYDEIARVYAPPMWLVTFEFRNGVYFTNKIPMV